MPLMGKSKNPTPQEMYRARKQREEDERDAFLPPGLINHGNTCFMNSVLQGLFATPLLADIVRFSLPPSSSPILSRRSPQLTNGHSYGGEFERPREDGMPLGDVFVDLMVKAWRDQEDRMRASMSPKDILTRLGAKYDQYLDFRQQDAHELLRHLLDAMRMEELDIIKKRQPTAPRARRKKKRVEADLASSIASLAPELPTADSIPEDERLTSFVDMVFGGRLASILVCDKCKKVSITYEEFNDLSLSIRAEDYEKSRKRDRLRNFAHKLGMRGRTHTRDNEHSESGPRASSVPASPTTTGRPSDVEHSLDLLIDDDGQRRRSIDADAVPVPGETSGNDGPQQSQEGEDRKPLTAVEEHVSWRDDVRVDDGPQRDKDEDSWIKLRRRISVGMRKGNGKKHKSKSKEPTPPVPSTQRDQSGGDDASKDEIVDSFVDVKMPSAVSATTSPNSSPALGTGIVLPKFSFARRPSPSRTNSVGSPIPSPSMSPRLSPTATPPLPRLDSAARLSLGSALNSSASASASTHAPSAQSKTLRPLKPPKPSRAESAYLRRLLADVPSPSAAPFSLFRGNSSTSIHELADVRTYINGIGKMGMGLGGQAQSLEDCLRMFTAVEVLDGENMVGCHRCWKIERGEYVPRGQTDDERRRREEKEQAADGREAENNEDEECDDDDDSSSNSSVKITVDSDEEPASAKDAGEPGSPLESSLELNDAASAPPGLHVGMNKDASRETVIRASDARERVSAPALVSVPSISMTAPDSSTSEVRRSASANSPLATTEPGLGTTLASNPSRDSLHIPPSRTQGQGHVRTPAERASVISVSTDASSLSSGGSDVDDDELESDTEPTEGLNSDSSSYRSARADAPAQQQQPSPSTEREPRLSGTTVSPTASPSFTASPSGASTRERRRASDTTSSIPRSKRVVPRRAYKRYLVATPPPVLVVHLKRFQQVGKTPSLSLQHQFFSNFKKLDDPVVVSEYLDLQPFLLPSKSQFFGSGGASGGGKRRKGEGEKSASEKDKDKGQERCMYRLYAVVVHIGNMLGGHYIAYTALPEAAPTPPPISSISEKSSESDLTATENPSSVVDRSDPPRPRVASPRSAAFVRSANPGMRSLPIAPETLSVDANALSPPGSAGVSTSASAADLANAAPTKPPTRQWCYVSDTVVRLATLEEVLKAKAYICMYERV